MRTKDCTLLGGGGLSIKLSSEGRTARIRKAVVRRAMRGRWELSGAQRNSVGLRDRGAVAPNRYPPYQTCHRRLQHGVREANLERILHILAKELQGKLQLEECSSRSLFHWGKRGLAVGPTNGSPLSTYHWFQAADRALRRIQDQTGPVEDCQGWWRKPVPCRDRWCHCG